MKRLLLGLAVLPIAFCIAHSQSSGPIEVEREFNVFTSHNAAGYFMPLFTSFQEGFATNLYSTALYDEKWCIALDFSLMGMFVPESHRTFQALLPESYADPSLSQTAEFRNGVTSRHVSGASLQPTVYGGIANPVFSAPQSESEPASFSRTVGFAEGNDIGLMPGVPHLQLMLGFPSRTELRARVLPVPTGDDRTLLYLGVALNQQVDRFLDLFGNDSTMALAVNGSFHYLNWTDIVSGTGFTAGMHFSKRWDGFTLFAGAQFETMSGDFVAAREAPTPGEVATDRQISPYEEIRAGAPIAFELESLNTARLLGGFSYRSGAVEIHADAAWASQPVISGGLTFWIASFGEKRDTMEVDSRW